MKSKRVSDLKLIKKMKELPCYVCDAPPLNDAHHLHTKGAGGGDELTNLISLCRSHHSLIHSMGVKSFVERFQLPVTFESGYPRLILDQ